MSETEGSILDPTPVITLQSLIAETNEDGDNVILSSSTPPVEGEDHYRDLRLLFLGCESQPPYGPYEHTARLFLDLITMALNTIGATQYRVQIDVYYVSTGHFPSRSSYVDYDGIILPGSFSAAYDRSQPWIQTLSNIIQEELVAKNIPTLGVCFGHQLYAHSFQGQGGLAIRCPAGPQAGRKVSPLSDEGRKWLPSERKNGEEDDSNSIQFFYTHGDMVEQLPPQGRVLYGTESVPIQGAIYYASSTTATSSSANDSTTDDYHHIPKPIAITIQAHPEYASSRSLGLYKTLHPIMDAMYQRQDIVSKEELDRIKLDAEQMFDTVQEYSIQTMITVGRLLGWFPPPADK